MPAKLQVNQFVVTVTHTGKFDAEFIGNLIGQRAWTIDSVEKVECVQTKVGDVATTSRVACDTASIDDRLKELAASIQALGDYTKRIVALTSFPAVYLGVEASATLPPGPTPIEDISGYR